MNTEFRGTTVYASYFAHIGKDQCPRDDIFSILHVFLDMVLGDVPWRAAARSKDKNSVTMMKKVLVDDTNLFFQQTILSALAADSSTSEKDAKVILLTCFH